MGHRADLLAAARRLLEDKGYAHITARDLVAASDTNLASIGYHFGSKAGLLHAAIGEVLEEWTEQLAEVAMSAAVATPLERARITWTTLLDSLDGRRALLLSFMEAVGQANRSPELREQFAAQYQQVRTRVAELAVASLQERLDPEDPQVRALASFVVSVCDGLALQWLLDPTAVPSGDELHGGLDMLWASPPSGTDHGDPDS